jgi:hypothetical protein
MYPNQMKMASDAYIASTTYMRNASSVARCHKIEIQKQSSSSFGCWHRSWGASRGWLF